MARHLATRFARVFATDISAQQLAHAHPANNIHYSVAPAEKTDFGANQFDLITVAQALHWFDMPLFYDEAKRTARNGGLLAVWGYSLLSIDHMIDPFLEDFYHNKVGRYWDPARKLVENRYADIPFPFRQIVCPQFLIRVRWTLDQCCGYLSSWSATQKYIRENKSDPVRDFPDHIANMWKAEEVKEVTFPVFMKLGRIEK